MIETGAELTAGGLSCTGGRREALGRGGGGGMMVTMSNFQGLPWASGSVSSRCYMSLVSTTGRFTPGARHVHGMGTLLSILQFILHGLGLYNIDMNPHPARSWESCLAGSL